MSKDKPKTDPNVDREASKLYKEKDENRSLQEQAINIEKSQGKKISGQAEQREEQHQPRDTA